MKTRRHLVASTITVLLVAGGCSATTTIDTSVSTTSIGEPTTTEAPLPGSVSADLTEMVSIAIGLGDLIAAGGSKATEPIARVHELWTQSGAKVNDTDPTLFREVEHQLGLLDIAVEKRRPADADKVARNLGTVVTTYLGRYPD